MIDIIIPTYNDKNNLITTLKSVPKNFTITVVDDCSQPSYKEEILQLFPQINFIKTAVNCGPGMARQLGINQTHQPYIMFIDSGDYFLPNIENKIIDTIINNKSTDMFIWTFYNEINKKTSTFNTNHLHGKMYNRKFLNKYNICFTKQGSYANEDIGFNRLCKLIIDDKQPLCLYTSPETIYVRTYDKDSLTQKDNKIFSYLTGSIGLIVNEQHLFNIAKLNNISYDKLAQEAALIMAELYRRFHYTICDYNDLAQQLWTHLYQFYHNIFVNYTPLSLEYFLKKMPQLIKQLYKSNKVAIPINGQRFLKLLEQNKTLPNYYLQYI